MNLKTKIVAVGIALVVALTSFGLSGGFNEAAETHEHAGPMTSVCAPAPAPCGNDQWANFNDQLATHQFMVAAYLNAVEEARLAAENNVSVERVREVRSRCNGDFYGCFKECTIAHEAPGDRYATNTGNGFYGAYQFNQNTWQGAVERAGYPEYAGTTANNAPPEVQDAAAAQLYAERGNQPWGGRC